MFFFFIYPRVRRDPRSNRRQSAFGRHENHRRRRDPSRVRGKCTSAVGYCRVFGRSKRRALSRRRAPSSVGTRESFSRGKRDRFARRPQTPTRVNAGDRIVSRYRRWGVGGEFNGVNSCANGRKIPRFSAAPPIVHRSEFVIKIPGLPSPPPRLGNFGGKLFSLENSRRLSAPGLSARTAGR